MTTDKIEVTQAETDSEMLARIGTDAQKWAQQFCSYNFAAPLDEGLMIGWFANAIEAGRTAGEQACTHRQQPAPDGLVGECQPLHDALALAYATGCADTHNAWAEGTIHVEPDFTEAASDYAHSIDLAALSQPPAPSRDFEAGRQDGLEEAAKVADTFAGFNRGMETASREAAKAETSIAGREVELETAVGFAKRASVSGNIAAAIRALRTTPAEPEPTREELVAEVERLRGFAQGIQDDWIINKTDSGDEWEEGYEDCLAKYASEARTLLAKATPQAPDAGEGA